MVFSGTRPFEAELAGISVAMERISLVQGGADTKAIRSRICANSARFRVFVFASSDFV